MSLKNQGTSVPTRKVTAATGGAALASMIVSVASYFEIEVPLEVALAAVTFLTFVFGYAFRERA